MSARACIVHRYPGTPSQAVQNPKHVRRMQVQKICQEVGRYFCQIQWIWSDQTRPVHEQEAMTNQASKPYQSEAVAGRLEQEANCGGRGCNHALRRTTSPLEPCSTHPFLYYT